MPSVNCTVKSSGGSEGAGVLVWSTPRLQERAESHSLTFQGKGKVLDRKEVFIMDGLVFFWNELGQGGDQERGEAPLGVRRC